MIIKMRTASFSFLEDVIGILRAEGFDAQIAKIGGKFVIAILGGRANKISLDILNRIRNLGMESFTKNNRYFVLHHQDFLEPYLFFEKFDGRKKPVNV